MGLNRNFSYDHIKQRTMGGWGVGVEQGAVNKLSDRDMIGLFYSVTIRSSSCKVM